ncbi:MAG TPA: heparinase II/III family protein [Agriterribacter sp.]|nr:heparinase II/III family protein [Agriterribacter sp.]
MKNKIIGLLLMQVIVFSIKGQGYSEGSEQLVKLENPVTVQYIKSKLKKSTPRLILTPAIEKNLKHKIKSDPIVKNYYEAIQLNAGKILTEPFLERKLEGRRLLGVSREMLYRMTVLSMVYRIEKNAEILKRINDELLAVCHFSDWNPSHFLDVAEMSLAVAIATDWAGKALPKATVDLAKNALIEKGIKASFGDKDPWWLAGTNNWNQVCNGGMIAASIVIAEKDPELAAKTISRSLEGMPQALKQYAPDGVYPEGATYWGYGTSFSVTTSSFLESAFGTDFGIAAYPSFLKSADFRLEMVAPTGMYFNFADCGDSAGKNGDVTLAWFAKQTGNPIYLEKEKFLQPAASMQKLSRLAGPGLVWLSQFEPKNEVGLPATWKGDGSNPVVVFRNAENNPGNYYFGGKGGKAGLSHGNMDAGSFVFELNGVRWVTDPGVQDYNELEQAGFDLWGMCQDCPRWSLVTKGNFGHSTLTVNDARFNVNGSARIIDYKEGNNPEATIDMTEIFSGNLQTARRKFIKDSDHSITVEDELVLNDSTKNITWAIMTTAEVIPTPDGAVLKQDGKSLDLTILSPGNVKVSTLMFDPPPMELDRKIEDLKKVEIKIPAYIFADKRGTIKVRLSSPE